MKHHTANQPRCPKGKFDKTTAAGGQMNTRVYPQQQHAVKPPKPKKA